MGFWSSKSGNSSDNDKKEAQKAYEEYLDVRNEMIFGKGAESEKEWNRLNKIAKELKERSRDR